jgi:hypothetical protein
LAAVCPSPARGAEGQVYGGPVGGTDIRNAYVPRTPGIYVSLADVPGWATQINGDNGRASNRLRRVNLTYNVDAAALSWTYPFRLLDGYLSSGAQMAYYPYVRLSINNVTQRISDWGDLYADLLKWTFYPGAFTPPSPGARPLPYGLTLQAAYSMVFPTGTFNTHQFTTGGHGTYFVIPNVAATYLTRPNTLGDGLEFSARLFLDHALENPLTHYHSGDVLDLDFAVSERRGRLQYGVAGFAATQLGPDVRNGRTVAPNGRYLVAVKAGPVVAYDFPDRGITLKAKLGFPIYARNSVPGTQFVFSVGFRLW